MPRARLAFLSLLAVLAAGCAAEDAPAGSAADRTDAPRGQDVRVERVPFSFEGETKLRLKACGSGSCGAASPAPARRSAEVEVEGDLVGYGLVMTWTPTTPLTREMRFGLAILESGGPRVVFADGPPPLTLADDGLPVEPGARLLVFAAVPPRQVASQEAQADGEQAFSISGALLVSS